MSVAHSPSLAACWLRFALILTPTLFISLLLITSHPYESNLVRDFVTPSADCTASCLLGVRPGVTLGTEAQVMLAHHGWVERDSIYVAEDTTRQYVWISWSWSRQSPTFLTGTGYMTYSTIEDGTIRDILVRTRLPFGDVLLSLGAPDVGELNRLEHIGRYPDQWLFVRNPARCGDFWHQPVTFYWVAPASLQAHSRSFNLLTDYDTILEKRGCLHGS